MRQWASLTTLSWKGNEMTEPTPSPAPRSAPRRFRLNSSVLTLILVVLLTGVIWVALGPSETAQGDSDPAGGAEPIPVITRVLEARTIALAPRYIGRTEASQRVEIRSRIRGFLHDRKFSEGGAVQTGQTLFVIDPKPFEAEVAIAKARIGSAEARRLQAGRQVERYRSLQEQGAATMSELDEWETAMSVAESDIQLYRAQLTQAELNLSYTTVTSPIDGVVGRAGKDVGSYVDDGSNSLLSVVEQIDPIYVRFSISEQDMLRWRRMREKGTLSSPARDSMTVRVTLLDGDAFAEIGFVTFVDIRVDETTSTILMRATLPNPDGLLRPGQFVHANLLGFERPRAIVVPKQAVQQMPASASVYVVAADGETVEVRTVRLGDWHGDDWIIEEGLEPGDEIVIDNILRLRHGAPIRIIERESDETEQSDDRKPSPS